MSNNMAIINWEKLQTLRALAFMFLDEMTDLITAYHEELTEKIESKSEKLLESAPGQKVQAQTDWLAELLNKIEVAKDAVDGVDLPGDAS